MHDRARPSPNPLVPDLQKRPHGQPCHVGQIRLSDWLKSQILRSDWSVAKPTPCTTNYDSHPWVPGKMQLLSYFSIKQ